METLTQNPWSLAGWLVCVSVILFGLLVLANGFRRRRLLARQFEKENLLLEERLRLLRETRKREEKSIEGWEGFANFVVARKVPHGDSGICSFYLKPKDERLELAPFQPGQHLVFQLPVPGRSLPLTRRYSLSDRAGQDYYRVSVKRIPPPAGRPELPPGLGSGFFHQEIEEESLSPYKCLIQVSSPAGSFTLDPQDTQPVILIGGGVGITPMLSMFNSVLEENESREIWLFYCVHDTAGNILFDEGMLHPRLDEILKARDNIHLHLYYSGIESAESIPRGGPKGIGRHCGRFSIEELKRHLSSNNYRFYVCGPGAMMNQFEEELEAWGVPPSEILTERFQPPEKKRAIGDFTPRTIQFAKAGKEIQTTAEDNSILDVAERAGVPIAFDCRAGSCGQCKVALVSGKVSYNIRTNYKCPPGSCLSCSCWPESDVVLDC